MNTKSLNRAIGLAMSALQQARHNGYSQRAIDYIKEAIAWLNRARASLRLGYTFDAECDARFAYSAIKAALILR